MAHGPRLISAILEYGYAILAGSLLSPHLERVSTSRAVVCVQQIKPNGGTMTLGEMGLCSWVGKLGPYLKEVVTKTFTVQKFSPPGRRRRQEPPAAPAADIHSESLSSKMHMFFLHLLGSGPRSPTAGGTNDISSGPSDGRMRHTGQRMSSCDARAAHRVFMPGYHGGRHGLGWLPIMSHVLH